MQLSPVLEAMVPYPFAKVGKISKQVEQRDEKKVIGLRIGIPDREAPESVKEAMAEFIRRKNSTYGYPCDVHPPQGIPELVNAIIRHYHEKYGSNLKPENIFVTGYTKPVLHNLARVFSKGKIIVPDPIYPAYEGGVILSEHEMKMAETNEKTGWLPVFDFEEGDVALYYCDPNNPTGSIAGKDYLVDLSGKMRKRNVTGIIDRAYKDFLFDSDVKPVSITQIPGMMENAFEVVSFSKHYNFVGIGLGWIVSSEDRIKEWMKLDENIFQGQPWYHQMAGAFALESPAVKEEMQRYWEELRERRDLLTKGLNELGLKAEKPKATPYIFFKVPEGYGDEDFILSVMINKAHVAFMPGSYFGKNGKGYARATIYNKKEAIEEGLEKIARTRSELGTW